MNSCTKKTEYTCPTTLKLTASNVTPIVGDDLILSTNTGQCEYNWTGPLNFAVLKNDGSDAISFDNIKINQSGWYRCAASVPDCNTLFDSIYIEVKYKQGTPPCSLTNNLLKGNGVPDLHATSVLKQYDNSWNCVSVYASASFGYPTYTFLFNSYNGNTEPKDGIYVTTDVQAFEPSQDANVIYLQCQYSNYFFKSWPNQNVYISHENGKLRIAFCQLNFSGDNGDGNLFTSTFSGEVTEN